MSTSGDDTTTTTIGSTSSSNSIFLTKEGGITPSLFCFMIGIPLILSGKWIWGLSSIIIGFILAIASVMEEQLQENEKQEIRFTILTPEELVYELEQLEEEHEEEHDDDYDDKDDNKDDNTIKKVNQNQKNYDTNNKQQQQHNGSSTRSTDHTRDKSHNQRRKKNNNNKNHNKNDVTTARAKCLASLSTLAKKNNHRTSEVNLPLLSQQAAYISLRLFPEDDIVVTAAISLLALVAKDSKVRQRNKYQADIYGLDVPIRVLRTALVRAQQTNDDDEEREEILAELQRKGCLYLGALADGDTELQLGLQIVQHEDGLEIILNAANWFRYHDGVVNWALWAIFILCFDTIPNQLRFIQLGGILTICTCLKNIPDSLEVNRHGIAILFDLLRQQQQQQQQQNGGGTLSSSSSSNDIRIDPWEVRKVALAAGLHDVVRNAMVEFSDSMDIMMMGQEMLIGTGYRGDIPQFQQL